MTIETQVKETVGILKINRPEVYNALNRETKWQMIETLQDWGNDNNISSVLLTANGKAFCSGQDLNDRMDKQSNLQRTLETEWIPLIQTIRNLPKIVISSLNGVVAGAGIGLAFASDLVYCSENTRFVSGFVQIGLVPDSGASYHFVKSLGSKKALAFFSGLDNLTGKELFEYGLINELSENPFELALEKANTLAQMAPLSLQELKKVIKSFDDHSFNQSLNQENLSQSFLGKSNDYQEGLSAFFQKRKANFKGN